MKQGNEIIKSIQSEVLHQLSHQAISENDITNDVRVVTLLSHQNDMLFETVEAKEKIDTVLSNKIIIIENQNSIIQYFQRERVHNDLVIQQPAKLEAVLDTVVSGSNFNNPTHSKEINVPVLHEIEMTDSLSELTAFENSLEDKNNYVDNLTYICGKKGTGTGWNNCYTLVDRLFTRKFMTFCSWALTLRESATFGTFVRCCKV